jgi:Intracellular proteinase inhibitor
MKRMALCLFLSFALASLASAQTPAPKRSWVGRLLHPFASSPVPQYNDPRLRGLALHIDVSPEPVKLSETRHLQVRVTLTNLSKRTVNLQFPTEQRIEIYLLNSTGRVLTKWSDNRAFANDPANILINPQEHIEYNEMISTRDLAANTVYIAEAFFPRYPELQVQKKFLTAP